MLYISMNEHINLAFIVSSNYSMNVFVDQIWVCIYFASDVLARPPSPENSKAVQAAGKLIKDITKSFVINK